MILRMAIFLATSYAGSRVCNRPETVIGSLHFKECPRSAIQLDLTGARTAARNRDLDLVLRLWQLIYAAARISEFGLTDVFPVEGPSLRTDLVRYLEQIKVDQSSKSTNE